MKNKINFLLFFITLLATPNIFAHLDVGEDKIIDSYLIDFGYSPENPTINDKISMVFNFLNNSNKENIDIDSIWLRLSNTNDVVFAGTLHPEEGSVALIYKFPEADDYEIKVRFIQNKKTLAEADFNIEINQSKNFNKTIKNTSFIVLIIIVIFSIIMYSVARIKRKKK